MTSLIPSFQDGQMRMAITPRSRCIQDSKCRFNLAVLALLSMNQTSEADISPGSNSAIDVLNPSNLAEGAYEAPHCKQLAAGELWGLSPDTARLNADNWALMAWGKSMLSFHNFEIVKMRQGNMLLGLC